MTLAAQFKQATDDIKTLQDVDNMSKLKLYALYKQATEGDVQGQRPDFTDMIGRAKWDAWEQMKGTNHAEAMQQYIDLVESLK